MAREPTQVSEFGTELRRLRAAVGLSMSGLGALIHFSKSHISKVENGQKSPSPHFIRMADSALAAGGRLIALADAQASRHVDAVAQVAGTPTPQPPSTARNDQNPAEPKVEVEYALGVFGAVLTNLRDLGQILNPSTVVDMLRPHFSALNSLAARLDGPLADETLILTAHFADFTGWMAQEAGDDVTALRWIDTSATLAKDAHENNLIAHSHVRRANIALYQQDAYGTIAFAKQAQEVECSRRVKSLAALREAQGHALAGSYEEFKACVDRAAVLHTESGKEQSHRPPLGPTRIADPVALTTGWSLYDLGRSAEAIEILEPLLARTEKTRSRAWARTATRLALALASMREIDRTCALLRDILSFSLVTRSATIRSDLRQLSRTLNRWSSDPSVQEIMPHLSAALLPIASRYSSPLISGAEDGR